MDQKLDQKEICCQMHGQKAILYKLNEGNPNLKFSCSQCIQDYYMQCFQCQTIEQYQNELKQQVKTSKLILNIMDEIFIYHHIMNIYFNNINNAINDLNQYVKEEKEALKNVPSDTDQKTYLEERRNKALQYFKNYKEGFTGSQNILKFDNFQFLLDELQLDSLIKYNIELKNSDICQQLQKTETDNQKLLYQQLPLTFTETEEQCHSLQFNDDASILLVGCNNVIKIMKFQDEKLEEIQEVKSASSFVNCFAFMNKYKQFASGSINSITIWQQHSINEWKQVQVLDNHKSLINSILYSTKNDILISGGEDKIINFFQVINDQWNLQQQIEFPSYIKELYLNEDQDKLFSNNAKKVMHIIEYQNMKWMIVKSIDLYYQINKFCFENKNILMVLPEFGEIIEKIEYDDQLKEITYISQIPIVSGGYDCFNFPFQYIKEKRIMIFKSGQNLKILKRLENEGYSENQQIVFRTNEFYGDVSKDGNFLVIWDKKTFLIQIYKNVQK